MSCQRKTPLRIAAGILCLGMLSGPVLAAEPAAAETGGAAPELAGVCITGLPEASAGSFRLGNRIIRSGDFLTAQQLAQMTFSPAPTEEDTSVTVRYLPISEDGIEPEAEMVIAIRGSRNDAPAAEDSNVETYKNLPAEGQLKVSEPEEQAMTYTLVRLPRRGEVILREDGSFLYTPKKNKVGTDSFTFTASDPAGNVSREATVTIRILKPADDTRYADTTGSECTFEAEWLRSNGIFSGEMIGGQACFCPEKAVTRGQFLAMLMQTLELPVDRSAVYTGFLDDAESWLRPYLAAAMRNGIIQGYPVEGGVEFRPDEPVTADQAAQMMQSAALFAIPTASMDSSAAEAAFPAGSSTMTRSDAAIALYRLHKMNSGLSISE